jgi:GT2 family glycosyltransferase
MAKQLIHSYRGEPKGGPTMLDTLASDQIIFEAAEAPTISVVVLAWRLTDSLLECLHSIASSVNAPQFETIIVLNGSTEPTRSLVRDRVTGARIVDLPENIGFGGGCNAGVAIAHGEYVVLINDDARAEPSALRQLFAAIDDRPSVAAAAGVLIQPDGRLQEAGSRVLASAATAQLAQGKTLDEARKTGFLSDREIDYGSGAAVIIRRTAFENIGGFDPRYKPAYFEDVDLSFRFKAMGLQVRLAPDAYFVHQSGASTSHDMWFREFASDHAGDAFIEKWADVLATAPDADAPLDRICSIPYDPQRAIIKRQTNVSAPETALSITRDYVLWLTNKLDVQSVERDAQSHELSELKTQFSHVQMELETQRLKCDAQSHELEGLKTQLTQIETDRNAAMERAAAAERDVMVYGARTHELTERLRDLENRGPIGIVKWKVGVAANRRAERRSHPHESNH